MTRAPTSCFLLYLPTCSSQWNSILTSLLQASKWWKRRPQKLGKISVIFCNEIRNQCSLTIVSLQTDYRWCGVDATPLPSLKLWKLGCHGSLPCLYTTTPCWGWKSVPPSLKALERLHWFSSHCKNRFGHCICYVRRKGLGPWKTIVRSKACYLLFYYVFAWIHMYW